MSDQHDYDLFYHALNYRGAQFGATPELAWQELLACHNRIVAKAVEESEKDAARYRWLREGCSDKNTPASRIAKNEYGMDWDAAIGAAIDARANK